MGFYDEDDIFCDIPECSKSTQQPAKKRLRLDEAKIGQFSDFPRSVFDETLNKPDSIDDDECQRSPEEVESADHKYDLETAQKRQIEPTRDIARGAEDEFSGPTRLANLRRIGLRAHPSQALRRYLLRSILTGVEPNPWVSKVHSEKNFRKKLRRYIIGMVIRACKEEGVEYCQYDLSLELEQCHADAFKFIDWVNEELIESLAAVGTFSSEQIRCARTNCRKAFVSRKVANVLVSRANGDYTHCQVPGCQRSIESNDDVSYLIIEGGSYGHRLEMPDYHQSSSKIKNILKKKDLQDSDEVIDEFPPTVFRSLVQSYMARYFCFWAFGDTEMWKSNGFTFFQAVSRN